MQDKRRQVLRVSARVKPAAAVRPPGQRRGLDNELELKILKEEFVIEPLK